jgi:hypothetical protein
MTVVTILTFESRVVAPATEAGRIHFRFLGAYKHPTETSFGSHSRGDPSGIAFFNLAWLCSFKMPLCLTGHLSERYLSLIYNDLALCGAYGLLPALVLQAGWAYILINPHFVHFLFLPKSDIECRSSQDFNFSAIQCTSSSLLGSMAFPQIKGVGDELSTARNGTALGDGMTMCTRIVCGVPNAATFVSHTHIHKNALTTKAPFFFVVGCGSSAMGTQLCTK